MASLPASQQLISRGFTYTADAQDLLLAGNDLPKWYAVFTLARHEKRVSAQCEQRQIESFLPLYKVKHRWNNRRTVDLELPLFPSYSFVRIGLRERVQVLQVPGVVRIVSSGREMQPLPNDYVNSLRDGLLAHRIEPHPDVAVGDWVRIKTGPMAGIEGVLERRKNELRVIVKLEMLARSVSVEVGAEEIESCEIRRAYS